MVVARELALRGWRVILLERSRGLGGTAGSDIKNGFMRKSLNQAKDRPTTFKLKWLGEVLHQHAFVSHDYSRRCSALSRRLEASVA